MPCPFFCKGENMLSTSTIGTTSEFIAAAALMQTGLEVAMRCNPAETWDLIARDPTTGKCYTYQVKTAYIRHDRGGNIVIDAKKGKGGIYTKDEIDFIVGVLDNKYVYVLENREIGTYWAKPEVAAKKWQLLTL
jgi:hypothetical protein